MKTNLHLTRRGLIGGAVALSALGTQGCTGGFNLTKKLYGWNLKVGDGKWVAWLVFLAFVILPVYSISLLVDAVVLNSIEFWTDKNPVSARTKDLGNGQTLVSKRTDDPNVVRHEYWENGKLQQVLFVERVGEDELRIVDQHGAPVVAGRKSTSGDIETEDAHGRVQARLTRGAIRKIELEIQDGHSPAEVVTAALAETGQLPRVRGASAHLRRRVTI